MIQTRYGSCHCGAVKFSCDIDLAPEGQRSPQRRPGVWYASTLRCNCSFCGKTRMWKNNVPSETFRLLQGADNLAHYHFGEGGIDHTFCKTCGIYAFVSASEPGMGGDFFCVNVACLDDVAPDELAAAPIRYENGAQDDWAHPPKITAIFDAPTCPRAALYMRDVALLEERPGTWRESHGKLATALGMRQV